MLQNFVGYWTPFGCRNQSRLQFQMKVWISRPHRRHQIDDAETVNGWVRPEGFQYKFVQIPARLVKEWGSSQVVTSVVPTTKSLMIKLANRAQRRGNSVMRVKWLVCMYLVWDLVGPINRLFLLVIVLLNWWLEGSFGNVSSLFNLALMEAPMVSSLTCNR